VNARWAVAIAVAGCGFPRPSDEFVCETNADCTGGRVCDERGYCVVSNSIPDAPPGTPDGPAFDAAIDCATFASRHFDACLLPAPAPALDLAAGSYVLDTDAATLSGPAGTQTLPNRVEDAGVVVSIAGLRVAVGATVRVIGSRPLIVASWSTIEVDGVIDASSNVTGRGAGGDSPDCASHAAGTGNSSNEGAGGGGGGGLRGAGGTGGSGDVPGGTAGGAIAAPLLDGGCPGGAGGNGDQPGGPGGSGGGAVQLTARISIAIGGGVHAGGAGGTGGTDAGGDADGGGGGGGSGGMIGLEAPAIAITASGILAANGGGGGQGADMAAGERGHDATLSATRAEGGSNGGSVDGDDGGRGSGGAQLAGAIGGQVGMNGGGGAGGGAGYIVIAGAAPQIDALAVLSPAFTTP
jgi:hypothetical protein